jgi:hypothetical protein
VVKTLRTTSPVSRTQAISSFSSDPLPPDPELLATFFVLWWPDAYQARLSHPRGAGSGAAGIRRADGERLLAALRRIDDIVR